MILANLIEVMPNNQRLELKQQNGTTCCCTKADLMANGPFSTVRRQSFDKDVSAISAQDAVMQITYSKY